MNMDQYLLIARWEENAIFSLFSSARDTHNSLNNRTNTKAIVLKLCVVIFIMERIKAIEDHFASYLDLGRITEKHDSTVQWLWSVGILKKQQTCCGEQMKVYSDKDRLDLYYFYCSRCKRKVNLREGSFFADYTKTPLIILTRLVFFYYADGINAKDARLKLQEQAGYDMTTKQIKKIYASVRLKILTYYDIIWAQTKIGGKNAVELDESKFTGKYVKSKLHAIAPATEAIVEPMEIGEDEPAGAVAEAEHEEIKGGEEGCKRKKLLLWGIGMYERGTGNVRVFANVKRDFDVISSLCKTHIKPGTTLYTDGWKAYQKLDSLGFHQIDIEKHKGFKKEPLSTSKIEGTWAQLKAIARMYSRSIPPKNCDEFLREFLFRRECKMKNERMPLRLVEVITKYQHMLYLF
eukprot:TRINITY_DN9204_c0_g1_i1.p1 TRINITY_DN9204_c0_g1~~TRINITY_DN9204_c0_g1_i1.p1  ORF type:complete len:440 (+),score=17.05 TRINITY_DN9204_c0_g1_i1:104-1321(+)